MFLTAPHMMAVTTDWPKKKKTKNMTLAVSQFRGCGQPRPRPTEATPFAVHVF